MIETAVTRRRWRLYAERQRDKKRTQIGVANTERELDELKLHAELKRGWRWLVLDELVELECFELREFYGERALELAVELQRDVDEAARTLESKAQELRRDFAYELARRGIDGLADVANDVVQRTSYLTANLNLASLMRTNERLNEARRAYRENDLLCRLAQQSMLPDNMGELELLTKALEREQIADFGYSER